MRILIVSNTYPPADISGVGALVYELAHQLGGPGGGDQVRVLTRKAPASDPYALGVGGGKGGFVLRCGLRYLSLLRKERYDLIHVHESDGAGVVVLWWLLRRIGWVRRCRLVTTLQVSYLQERLMTRDVRADGEVVSTPTREEKWFRYKARIQAGLGRMMVRLADAVVAPSQVTAEELREDYGAREVRVIYNGIAPDSTWGRRDAAWDTPAPTVLYVGRMRTRKAVAVLLVAFRRVLERLPEARLVLVGDGEQRPALEALHRELELGDAVRFTGKLDRAEVGRQYAAADVYCLPSLYEGFPLAILEAMAAGLPVVATRVSGNPEAVEDGETGLLVEKERAGELAEALLGLLLDLPRARRMGARAARRLEEHFTIDRIAGDYKNLWRELTGESVGSANHTG